MRHAALYVLAAVLVAALAAPASAGIIENAVDRIYDIADPVAENILGALREGDYQRAVRDFDATMLAALPPDKLAVVDQTNRELIGTYLIKRRHSVTITEEGFIVVQYACSFTLEDPVMVRVVFRRGVDDHKLTGLWFDSPKLRQAQ
ncbi:MAG: DUF3887 domain-containing protein [Candidatus Alcyoniella australis]|nr:DUF3887 domain-containing protein [Candidatus Alcyoniella australis]